MQRIWSCGERCLGLWTLNESSEAVRSLRYLCRCGGSGEYATRSPSIRFACFINPCSWSWQCAIDSHLRESRTVQDIYLVTCGQQSGGNDLGEKSCTNGNSRSSRSSCNQDALAAIPCRSFIVVGLQTGECVCKVSGFQTFGEVGRTLAGNHRRDHRWVGGWRLLYDWRKLARYV
ncbi:unnamed protein product [Sphagnum jensenii]|uniref:Uncharacterized protein n=1 Tax=Sphagnum jensenii TaxID=128206 RepID=A0ABP0WDY4_9BRYO